MQKLQKCVEEKINNRCNNYTLKELLVVIRALQREHCGNCTGNSWRGNEVLPLFLQGLIVLGNEC